MLQVMLERSYAGIDIKDRWGHTPLHDAQESGARHVIEYLERVLREKELRGASGAQADLESRMKLMSRQRRRPAASSVAISRASYAAWSPPPPAAALVATMGSRGILSRAASPHHVKNALAVDGVVGDSWEGARLPLAAPPKLLQQEFLDQQAKVLDQQDKGFNQQQSGGGTTCEGPPEVGDNNAVAALVLCKTPTSPASATIWHAAPPRNNPLPLVRPQSHMAGNGTYEQDERGEDWEEDDISNLAPIMNIHDPIAISDVPEEGDR
jgi:hypothetical protein